MVNTGTELTFTLSAHTNYKVKTLTINGTTYSAVTDNTITKKVKIEKNTVVSAVVEADTGAPVTKYKVTVIQPENGKIEVTPALPAGKMVDTGIELTFTLSAHTGYNVKTLTINGTVYSDISGNSITKKVKIEQETEVSATVEADTGVTQIGSFTDTQGNTVRVIKDTTTQKYSLKGNVYIDDLQNLYDYLDTLTELKGKDLDTSELLIDLFKKED